MCGASIWRVSHASNNLKNGLMAAVDSIPLFVAIFAIHSIVYKVSMYGLLTFPWTLKVKSL